MLLDFIILDGIDLVVWYWLVWCLMVWYWLVWYLMVWYWVIWYREVLNGMSLD